MKTKITSLNYKIQIVKGFLVVVMLFFASSTIYSQVEITDVFPTRVTTGSTITIKGIFFTNDHRINIVLKNVDEEVITTKNHRRNGAGEMTFEISFAGVADILDAKLTIGLAGADPRATKLISYIAPKYKTLTTGESFFVKEIYTNWDYDGRKFWRSGLYTEATKDTTAPNNKHELLGYKIRRKGTTADVIYSTGVQDSLLEKKLVEFEVLSLLQITDSTRYRRKTFKAYSTNGVSGLTKTDNFIIAGDLIDKKNGPDGENFSDEQFQTITGIKDLTILEVIIDGQNGLELGTGITNFNRTNNVQFFSGNAKPGAILDDSTPDLLITQIADAGGRDVYYYADPVGNVVGRPIRFYISQTIEETILAKWKVNLYTFIAGEDFASATPNARSQEFVDEKVGDRFKPIRMAAFELADFEITTELQLKEINNINMNAGGSADMAFMAYNADTFDPAGPVAKTVLPQYVCRVNGLSSATFKIVVGQNVGIEDGNGIRQPSPLKPSETLRYQLWKDGKSSPTDGWASDLSIFNITNIEPEDLGIYRIRIENNQGTVIVPVELIEGGTPTKWDGASWDSFPYTDVDPADRNLFFANDYNGPVGETLLLEGCDCRVLGNKNVIIGEGKTLKLYGKIVVDAETPKLDDEGHPMIEEIPAGTFTLENNASLIQTKPLPLDELGNNTNENSGKIIVKRIAEKLKKDDYVYWSSPVAGFDVNNIPGTRRYEWDVTKGNGNGTYGNWIAPSGSGIMTPAKGYIVRVPASVPEEPLPRDPEYNYSLNYTFDGVPNNGDYSIQVKTTPFENTSTNDPLNNHHWNLIGNPYPSAIDPTKLLLDNSTVLNGVLQIWTHGTAILEGRVDPYYQHYKSNYSKDDYLTLNLTAPTNPAFEGYIASGQGFVVQAKADANDKYVTFTNAMRFTPVTENAHNNTQFFRGTAGSNMSSSESTEKQLIWLALSNESKISTVAVVGYVQGATNGNDQLYDANSGAGNMRIYSVLDNSDLIIQGRALPFEENDKVPLGVEILKNGIYNIGIDHLKGSVLLNEDQGIYLEDTYNNVIHDLKNAPYGFTATAGTIKDRFVLRYTNETLSVDDQEVSDTFVYVKNDQLHVKASKNIEAVVVYDLTGKKLMDYKLDGYSDTFNSSFQFSRGAYLTVIKFKNSGTITKKVMN